MRAFLRRWKDPVQIALGLLVTLLAASDMVGHPARLVQLIALGAGAFGAGVGVGAMVARRGGRRSAGAHDGNA